MQVDHEPRGSEKTRSNEAGAIASSDEVIKLACLIVARDPEYNAQPLVGSHKLIRIPADNPMQRELGRLAARLGATEWFLEAVLGNRLFAFSKIAAQRWHDVLMDARTSVSAVRVSNVSPKWIRDLPESSASVASAVADAAAIKVLLSCEHGSTRDTWRCVL